ncbi:DUF2474 family protein [Kangiella koreensis]|uniref:DUF2474 domain-containing protein n=1 Tax=Kangiella koreensis (strain DSM 16069 / JCM 12317 / KCTC 12182 / SW-125) TaxID=523791 RepID=C7RCZ3_KANKD|nr:DUF2474 family protein [Kangiella koreensis]ACV27135.1 hypothetical protein Kkor_1723 [Kangiella koreensis DSM 16069]
MSEKQDQNYKPGWQKALWFVGLWLAGVLTLATIGYGIRLFLG